MRVLPLAAVAGLALSTPALAQNAAPGGFHLGALAGYEGIDVQSADGAVTADADAAVYGITAGYDLSLGSAFVGIEGELSTSGSSTRFPDSFTGARDGLEGAVLVGVVAHQALLVVLALNVQDRG